MYGNNNISPFSQTSNPFMPPAYDFASQQKDLAKMYAELEAIKSSNSQPAKTVFTEIADEMSDISDDERAFIEGSKEYGILNQQYQVEFSSFLINKFGAEYSSSQYGKTPERILGLIREKKEQYKNQFAANLNEIKENNKSLVSKNNELAEVNKKLQIELEAIKNKLGEIVV
jgi:hypothetical protein